MTTKATSGQNQLDGVRGKEPKPGDDAERTPLPTDDNPDPAAALPADRQAPEATAEKATEETERPAQPRMSPHDERRSAVFERFSKHRATQMRGAEEQNLADDAQYGSFAPGRESAEEAVADDGSAAAEGEAGQTERAGDTPQEFELKVYGSTIKKSLAEIAALADMTTEEVEANPERAKRFAQKELATQHNLDKSKELLRTVQTGGARDDQDDGTRATRPAPDQERQPGRTSADRPDADARDTSEIEEVAALVEEMQVGEASEIAPKLLDVIDKIATRRSRSAATETIGYEKIAEDERDANATISKFLANKPELKGGGMVAANAFSAAMFEEYREDLRNDGITDEILNKATPDQIFDAHRIRRLRGNPNVRKIDDGFLAAAHTRMRKAFGITDPNPNPNPQPSLDRRERKVALQPQPRRASVPPAAPPAQSKPLTRKDVVNEMRQARPSSMRTPA